MAGWRAGNEDLECFVLADYTNMTSFLVEPWTYNYLNSHYTNKVNAVGDADITGYKGMHTTEVLQQKALAMIDDAANRSGQFYMQIAPGKQPCIMLGLTISFVALTTCIVAPHLQIGGGSDLPVM